MTISVSTISLAKSTPIEQIIARRGIKLRGRIDRVGPCPRCGGDDRFSVNTKKQVFNCRHCNTGGDVIELVQFLYGCDFREACKILTGEMPSTGVQYGRPQHRPKPQPRAEDDERRQRAKARYLFRSSIAAAGTPVEGYLRSRNIAVLTPAIRFLPPLKPNHHPAMLVPYGLPEEPEPGVIDITQDAITAVQLTLLKPDGTGKADVKPNKISIASPAGKPMVVAPINDLLGLAICEGVEDALSAYQATGHGAWASGGDGFLPKLADAVPDYVEAVTIYAHPEERAQRCAHELAEALAARGVEVFIEGIRL
jgi:putative DNA primase/helicase